MRICSHQIVLDLAIGVMNLFAFAQALDPLLAVASELLTYRVIGLLGGTGLVAEGHLVARLISLCI